MLIAAVETATPTLLVHLERLAGQDGLSLAITRQRGNALGLASSSSSSAEQGALLLRGSQLSSVAFVKQLAGVLPSDSGPIALDRRLAVEAADAIATASMKLAKQARLLPAVLLVPSAPLDHALTITTAQLERWEPSTNVELERISEARVPLAGHEDCRLVLFRDSRDGSEHVAVLIGAPKSAPVSVRLHSACLTGDLLASLRCDCGDQLRSGVKQLAAAGGGVLLYLAQEGRGIGLANKLRAYELQDTGLDTIEADGRLGFGADERSYGVAASMLRHLGMTRIQLLTNNVEKIEALRSAGIEVVGGQRLIGAVNRHNARYVHAKRERAGHLMPAINLDEIL
ncbi:GTP cyclohydrolase II [Peristeroidobacter agariperforans]|uniref:GTP cyclohydrolase II n=1 Tax=Peristeroidobacter agariperforans TaxID=268404 RepID=UPI00101C3637|nr:GTP cyclohydrolase II [Peristeroidobacter agariperforans]